MKQTTPTNAPAAEPAMDNAFIRVLQDHRKGQIISDLSEALAKVVQAVEETGNPGSITVKFKLRPATEGEDSAVLLTDEISVKAPRATVAASIFFADTETWQLTRDNPKQMKLKLELLEAEQEEEKKKAAAKAS